MKYFIDSVDKRARKLVVALFLLLLQWSHATASERTGLPLDLSYGMTREQVELHLKPIAMYTIDGVNRDQLVFMISDGIMELDNLLSLSFHDEMLVQITSSKFGMPAALRDKYVTALLRTAQQWKDAGVVTIFESKTNGIYLYRDNRSYMKIGTGAADDGYYVDVSFTEREFFDKQ
jgi:hypothetical protein